MAQKTLVVELKKSILMPADSSLQCMLPLTTIGVLGTCQNRIRRFASSNINDGAAEDHALAC